MSIDTNNGVWTGLLKWSLSQHDTEPATQKKQLTEEDKQFLRNVFESLVVDEVRRMKIISEVLRMPEDEAGIRRLLQESSEALAKLQEVTWGQSEEAHYGQAKSEKGHNVPITAGSPPPTSSASASSSLSSSGPLPVPTRTPSASASVPTLHDYKTANVSELAVEMMRRKEGALEELDDRVLVTDLANDFLTVGGLEPLLLSMLSRHDSIRWRAAQALSTIVQNNPKAQLKAFEHNALDYLLPLLTPPQPLTANAISDEAEEAYHQAWTVVVKGLTALSALIRAEEMPIIRDTCMRKGGGDKLLTLLLTPHCTHRVQTKVFTLLRHIIHWYPSFKAQLLQSGALSVLVKHLGGHDDINHREACCRLVEEFAKLTGTAQDKNVAKELREKKYGLKEVLKARIQQIKDMQQQDDREAAEDELTHCKAIVKLCKF